MIATDTALRAPDRGAALGDVCVLFADLAGFSALTARLIAEQARGAEAVHDALNPLISAVIDAVQAHGGMVTGLSGDAVTALWPLERAQAAQTCANGLAAAVARVAAQIGLALPIRVVLDAGPVELTRVGGHLGDWRVVYTGPPLARLPLTAPKAKAGEIWQSPAFAEANSQAPKQAPQQATRLPTAVPQNPVALAGWAGETGAALTAEYRKTSTLFVLLPTALTQGDALAKATRTIQQIAARHDGTLLQAGPDDKGTIALLVWGLATGVSEADADLAIAAGLAVVAALPGALAGLGTGQTLAGRLGAAGFAQYTVLGAHVNLAAGALSLGQPGLLCDAATRAASTAFGFEDGPKLRGKDGADTPLFHPIARQAKQEALPQFAQPLIGRDAELAALRKTATQPGGLAWLEAEAGAGKSHLIASLIQGLQDTDCHLLRGAGDRLRRMSALGAWRPIFAALPEGHLTNEGLSAALGSADSDRLAVLNPVLPQPMPETAQTRALNPVGRAQVARQMMARLLAANLGDGATPALLIFEDVHWLDTASWQLLAELRRQCPTLAMILVSRPMDAAQVPTEITALRATATVQTLDPLGTRATNALICETLAARTVPDVLARRIYEQSGGHALYTVELAASLLASGAVHIEGGHCLISAAAGDLAGLRFPDGIEGAIAARIGQLSLPEQQVLKVASVQGRRFSGRVVAACLPDVPVAAALASIAATGLILDQGGHWRFHHALTREAAYGLLISAQARTLHAAVAEALDEPQADPTVLAQHWTDAGQDDRALPWLIRAIAQAEAAQASFETLSFVEQALAILERLPPEQRGDIAPEQRSDWHFVAGRAARTIGQFDRSERHLKSVLGLMHRDYPTGMLRGVARVLSEIWRYWRGAKLAPDAAPFSSRDDALDAPFNAAPDAAATTARLIRASDAYLALGEIHYDRADTLGILLDTIAAYNVAQKASEASTALGWANANMSMIGFSAPFLVPPKRHLAAATDLAEMLDDAGQVSWIRAVLGNYHMGAGDWAQSRENLEIGMRLAAQSGQVRNGDVALASLANMCRLHGLMAEADRHDAAVQDAALDRSVTQVEVWALTGRVKSLLAMSDFDGFDTVSDRFQALMADPGVWGNASANSHISVRLYAGIRALHLGDLDQGLALVQQAAKTFAALRTPQVFSIDVTGGFGDAVQLLAQTLGATQPIVKLAKLNAKAAKALAKGYPPAQARGAMAAGDLAALRDQPAKAIAHWQAALTAADQADMPYDIAMAAHRLARVATGQARTTAIGQRDAGLTRAGISLPAVWPSTS